GYTFDGICAYMYKDGEGVGFLENLYNLLLVDPAKDDNQVSGKALKGIGNLHAAAATVKDAPLVLKPEERVAWAKAKVERESLANELAKAGVIVSHTGRAVDFTSSESSFKKVNNAKPTEIKKFAGQRNIF
ncbi:MAG: hypothetical protein HUJ95_02585, partial [Bacteroidales bacterium]|nr:hypothetical protein [Bacteroidales bacterium]